MTCNMRDLFKTKSYFTVGAYYPCNTPKPNKIFNSYKQSCEVILKQEIVL